MEDARNLYKMVEETHALAQDTNRMVHKMRRGARWAIFFQIVWWLTILGVSGAAYYYYVQPYVQKIEQAYGQAQATGQQAKTFGQTIQNFFANWGK